VTVSRPAAETSKSTSRALSGSSVIFSPNTTAGDQISIEDYAVALVDEIENPAHARQRFAVAN